MLDLAAAKARSFFFLERLSLLKFYLLVTFLGSLLTIVFYFPDLDLYAPNQDFYERINQQIEHPFEPSTYSSQGEIFKLNHFNKRVFRLTIPLLARTFHLDAQQLFIAQFLCLPLFFFLLAKLLLQLVHDRVSCFFLALSFCFFYPSKSFCFYLPTYDCFAYLLLLVLWLNKTPLGTLITLFFLAFCDERAFVAALFVVTGKIILEQRDVRVGVRALRNGHLYAGLFVVATYLGFRYSISTYFGLQVALNDANGVGFGIFRENYPIAPFCMFESLEGWWIICFLALYRTTSQRDALPLLFSVIGIFTMGTIGLCVVDITRSLAYIFILAFFWLAYVYKDKDEAEKRSIALLICFTCAFIPTYIVWGGAPPNVHWLSPVFPKIVKFLL